MRTRIVTAEVEQEMLRMHRDHGFGPRYIACKYGLSEGTVYRVLNGTYFEKKQTRYPEDSLKIFDDFELTDLDNVLLGSKVSDHVYGMDTNGNVLVMNSARGESMAIDVRNIPEIIRELEAIMAFRKEYME